MTDMGTADRIYVCGPDCKALSHEPVEAEKTSWWRVALTISFCAVIIAFATVGALDVGVRSALDYWNF